MHLRLKLILFFADFEFFSRRKEENISQKKAATNTYTHLKILFSRLECFSNENKQTKQTETNAEWSVASNLMNVGFVRRAKLLFFPLNGLRSPQQQQKKKKRTEHRVNLFFMRMMHNTLLHEISHSFAASRASSVCSLDFIHSFEMVLHGCDPHKVCVCVFFSFFSSVHHHFWHKHHQYDRHFFSFYYIRVSYIHVIWLTQPS